MIKLLANSSTGVEGGVSEFQWGALEQVWPFEKAADGSTLYCKEIAFGSLPAAGVKTVAHGLSDISKLHFISAIAYHPGANVIAPLSLAYGAPYNIALQCSSTDLQVTTFADMSGYTTCPMKLIYAK